jgi:flagellar biosynthesis protein FlhB
MEELLRIRAYALDIDLQFFASAESEGRTEAPTPRRLREAKRQGRFAKTPELAPALVLLAGFAYISIIATKLFQDMQAFMTKMFQMSSKFRVEEGNVNIIFAFMGAELMKYFLPLMLLAFVVAILGEVIQVGFNFSMEPMKPSWNKISFTWEKLRTKLLFSRQMLMGLLKTFLKLVVIAVISYAIISGEYKNLINLIGAPVNLSVEKVASVCFKIVMWVAALFLLLSVLDFFYQKFEFLESQKVTPHESKRDMIEDYGNPLIKSKTREMFREMVSRRRMLDSVPKADVVITNPTHYSVALQYDSAFMTAPRVVAKGEGHLALKIREIAIMNDIPLREDRQLAKLLYKTVEIDEEIPRDLYSAVADILRIIYDMKQKEAV